jgi:signal transduction histidine kinase
MAPRRTVSVIVWVTAVLLAVLGTVEYVALQTPHLLRALAFLYAATGVLLAGRRYPLGAPVLSLTILAAFSLVDAGAATTPNSPLFLTMFCLFTIAAFSSERRAVFGGVAALGCLVVVVVRIPHPDVGGVIVLVLLMLLAWGAGRLAALRARLAQELRTQQQRAAAERAAEARRAVDIERSRIARELHDIVAHHISVIVVQAQGGRRSIDVQPEDARQAFRSIETMGAEAMTEMRQLLGVLRGEPGQVPLAPASSVRRLDALVDQLQDSGQQVALTVEGDPLDLPPGLDLAAYRVVQEALTNVVKHTQQSRAEVTITYAASRLGLRVADSGPARDPSTETSGYAHGLLGMRERVALYGGTLQAGEGAAGGFVVDVTLPIRTP